MIADMAWLYAEAGEEVRDVVIDGAQYRAIVGELETMSGEFELSASRRQSVSLLHGDMDPLPRPGYVMSVDGTKWTVESAASSGLLCRIIMAQYD